MPKVATSVAWKTGRNCQKPELEQYLQACGWISLVYANDIQLSAYAYAIGFAVSSSAHGISCLALLAFRFQMFAYVRLSCYREHLQAGVS